ncbi:MAG: hypothetical protein LC121_07825 [Anaerolineae bacterium]|nr:hypothetical protein [Anaerolineae bacterium]
MTNAGTRRRPAMTSGYGISTKPQGMLDWSWVDDQMTKSRSYWVCSTRPDGRPHAAPVWGVWYEASSTSARIYSHARRTSPNARTWSCISKAATTA